MVGMTAAVVYLVLRRKQQVARKSFSGRKGE
jgi:hypothetical protein